MRASRLRKKSPSFRQGYHTGRQDGIAKQVNTMEAGEDSQNWQQYVDEMKDSNTEEYLAGDIEGYRRGYTDGSDNEKQERTDLTLAGVIVIAIIAGSVGFIVCMVIGFN